MQKNSHKVNKKKEKEKDFIFKKKGQPNKVKEERRKEIRRKGETVKNVKKLITIQEKRVF